MRPPAPKPLSSVSDWSNFPALPNAPNSTVPRCCAAAGRAQISVAAPIVIALRIIGISLKCYCEPMPGPDVCPAPARSVLRLRDGRGACGHVHRAVLCERAAEQRGPVLQRDTGERHDVSLGRRV